MNTKNITVNIPFEEWENLQNAAESIKKLSNQVIDLENKLHKEKLNKAVVFKIGTDFEYKVTVTTLQFGDTWKDMKNFEDELKNVVEKEMALRKEYEDKIDNYWKVLSTIPLWLLKIFGFKEKNIPNNG